MSKVSPMKNTGNKNYFHSGDDLANQKRRHKRKKKHNNDKSQRITNGLYSSDSIQNYEAIESNK